MQPPLATGLIVPRDLPAQDFAPFVEAAEALGFQEIWVVEDLGFRGGIAQATAALARTDRIRVGLGILPAAARNVHFAAMEIATLAQLFPGRLVAGIGHGMPDWMRQAGCWPARPLGFLESFARDLRALLAGGESTRGVRLDPSSVPALAPPIVLGVRGPRSLAAAGQVADGVVLAEPVTPTYVEAARERMGLARPLVVGFNAAAVDGDSDRAIERVRPALAWIGEPDWAPHLVGLTFAEDLARLRGECASPSDFAARLPAEWISQLALAGTPAQVSERLADLARVGLTSAALFPSGPDPLAALESLATLLR